MTHDIESRDQIIEDLSNRLDRAEAEVERLNDDLEATRVEADVLDTKIVDLMQEIDRLKAHTWEQERAAVVKYLKPYSSFLPFAIEEGKHWSKKMKDCPNPKCKGSEDSLEIVKDERYTRNRRYWVHCKQCGVAGPTAGPLDESAIEAWDALPRITTGEGGTP